MIEIFQEWCDNRHEYAKNWKKRTREGWSISSLEIPADGNTVSRKRVGWIDVMGFQRGDMLHLELKI